MNREVFSRTVNTKDEWETPNYFFFLLNREFNFTLDPCASLENRKCEKFYSIEEDGLKQDWSGETVFVNPPFSHISEWVKKCFLESQKPRTKVVMILPSRTDTRYWHDYIMKAKEIRFCKGRVNFLLNGKKPKNSSTFPLAVIIFEINDNNGHSPDICTFEHKNKLI